MEISPCAASTVWQERGRVRGSTGASQKDGTEQMHWEVEDWKGTGSFMNHFKDLEASALNWLKLMTSIGREEGGKLFQLLKISSVSIPPLT